MWELAIQLDAHGDEPRYLQIARAIADAVRAGRLRPGARLPSTRALAAQLDVHRKTVTAAYRELAGEGWIAIERARGALISRELPELPRQRGTGEPAARAGFELPPSRVARPPRTPRAPGEL